MNEINTAAAGTVFEGHLIGAPYERVFFEPGEELAYIRNYLDLLGGTVESDFRIEEYFNLRVVGLQSPLGNVSLVAIADEHRAQLPDFIRNTNTMFVVDSIDAVYAKAEAAGIPILQPRTTNIMGAQGRLEIAPGYILELAEATNRDLFHPDVEAMGLPASRP